MLATLLSGIINDNFDVVQVQPSAFQSLMQYIYTARLETHIDSVDDCIRLAVQCRLPLLKKELEDMVKKVTSFGKFMFLCIEAYFYGLLVIVY